jgi:hypothetical protein
MSRKENCKQKTGKCCCFLTMQHMPKTLVITICASGISTRQLTGPTNNGPHDNQVTKPKILWVPFFFKIPAENRIHRRMAQGITARFLSTIAASWNSTDQETTAKYHQKDHILRNSRNLQRIKVLTLMKFHPPRQIFRRN